MMMTMVTLMRGITGGYSNVDNVDNVGNVGLLVFSTLYLLAKSLWCTSSEGGLKFVNLGFNPNLTCFTSFHRKFSSM